MVLYPISKVLDINLINTLASIVVISTAKFYDLDQNTVSRKSMLYLEENRSFFKSSFYCLLLNLKMLQ